MQAANYRSMKLSERVLEELAKMVVGDAKHFPYRSSSYITEFFQDCDTDYRHNGSTRNYWVAATLKEAVCPAPIFARAGFLADGILIKRIAYVIMA